MTGSARGEEAPDEEAPDGAADDRAGDDFFSRVLDLVDSIPPGLVMTYGGVAAALGSRSSRGVGKVMAYGGAEVPWWRVIRASGHPAVGHEQRALAEYRVEGTPLVWSRTGTWRVDLRAATWSGRPPFGEI